MTDGGDMAAPGASGPFHMAVIPDGSRRWARQRGLSVADGYRAGVRTGLEVLAWCREAGVRHLTAFGSSQENLDHRTAEELVAIHAAVRLLCLEATGIPGVVVHVFGAPEKLPAFVPDRAMLRELALAEPPAAPLVLHVAVGYSARDDLAALAAAARAGGERVAREPQRYLRSACVPPVDVVLRTGARPRLSGFLPLQSAYAEIFFLPTLWPALRRDEFAAVLAWYAARDRPGE